MAERPAECKPLGEARCAARPAGGGGLDFRGVSEFGGLVSPLPGVEILSFSLNHFGRRRDPCARGARRLPNTGEGHHEIAHHRFNFRGRRYGRPRPAGCGLLGGYEPVWIQGHKICKIKTPKLGLKANTGPELKKSATFKARSAAPARRVRCSLIVDVIGNEPRPSDRSGLVRISKRDGAFNRDRVRRAERSGDTAALRRRRGRTMVAPAAGGDTPAPAETLSAIGWTQSA